MTPAIGEVIMDTTLKEMRLGDGSTAGGVRQPVRNNPVFTGLLDLSDSTAGQVKFPATQNASSDANTLDDYEEGTWTVTLYDAVSGGNASATTVTGYYTKVGNLVTCWFSSLNNIDTTGMTGGNVLYISLPFTAGQRALGSICLESFTYTASRVQANSNVTASAARARILVSASAQAVAALTVASITTGTSDIADFHLSYRI